MNEYEEIYEQLKNLGENDVNRVTCTSNEQGKAKKFGNKSAIKFLLEQGADINKENEEDETPLFLAYKNGNGNIVKYLVEKGADINKENEEDETPLFLAYKNRNEDLVKYLIDHIADVDKVIN